MNRLWIRLTLAFVAVTLFGVLIVAVIAGISATAQVNRMVARQREIVRQDLLDALERHYSATGSWMNVDEVLAGFRPAPGDRALPGLPPERPGFGQGGPQRRQRTLVLADASYAIVYDVAGQRTGTPLSPVERSESLPVLVGGAPVGYLLATSSAELLLVEAQRAFLAEILRNLALAALIACALAALIAAIISRALARPLNALAGAAQAFSQRQWQQRVPVSSTLEIGAVARAFNDMAGSLEQAEVNRRNLTADIAHELRTPLTVIQGNLRAMLDGVYPLEQTEVANIYDETRLLSRLVDDLRELALAEAGQLTLRSSPVALRALLASATEPLHALAEERGLTLVVDLPDDALSAQADADRARQVLSNLIGNAFRHTPQGGTVSVSARRDGARARIEVRDTGEGIATGDLPHIFDRFYRADKARARASGGSGLGLPISKVLVEAMGGAIGVASAPGAGSVFWFTLPVSVM